MFVRQDFPIHVCMYDLPSGHDQMDDDPCLVEVQSNITFFVHQV